MSQFLCDTSITVILHQNLHFQIRYPVYVEPTLCVNAKCSQQYETSGLKEHLLLWYVWFFLHKYVCTIAGKLHNDNNQGLIEELILLLLKLQLSQLLLLAISVHHIIENVV